MGSLSIWHWLIVLLVAVLIFGTKRLSTLGSDLGGAVKGFRKAMAESEEEDDRKQLKQEQADADFSESRQNEASGKKPS